MLNALLALADIAAEITGIKDGLECFKTGDLDACTATALNVLGTLAGGLAAKVGLKYAVPWKWKEGLKLAKAVWKHADEAITAFKSWGKAKDEVKAAEKTVAKLAKACSSFVPGTGVLMADGTHKPIENVKVGDKVLATDPQTGKTESKSVIALITSRGDKNLVQITVDTDGTQGNATGVVIATDRHPFWSSDQRHWFNASALRPGMRLLTPNSATVEVLAIRQYHQADQRVHNLTIASTHTYHVAVGDIDALVHNASNDGCETASEVISKLSQGRSRNPNFKVVSSEEDLRKLWDKITRGGKVIDKPNYPGKAIELPDGTQVFWRNKSKSTGATIDVNEGGRIYKVHIDQ